MDYRSGSSSSSSQQWLPPNLNSQPSSSSSSPSLQTLQDQFSRLSMLPLDPPPSGFPNYPHPSSTPTPDPQLNQLDQLRSLLAAQTQNYFPDNQYPPILGSGSSRFGYSPRNPTLSSGGVFDRQAYYSRACDNRLRSQECYNTLRKINNISLNNSGGYYNDPRLFLNHNNNTMSTNGFINGIVASHRRCQQRRGGFNNNNNNFNDDQSSSLLVLLSSCERMWGKIVAIVKFRESSQLLLKKFEMGHMDGLKTVVAEIKDNIVEVLTDHNGSQFFQKFLRFLDFQDVHQLLRAIATNIYLCFDNQGTRAAQEILKHVDRNNLEVKSIIVQAIKEIFSDINRCRCQNGYHFIEAILKAFQGVSEVIQPLMSEVAKYSVEISMDKVGCCKLQQIITFGQEPERSLIIDAILANAFELSVNDYGNFVVQFIATLKGESHIVRQLINTLQGYFVDLSKNKCGSHVVQKCLTAAEDEYVEHIMNEICHPLVFLDMCQHPFGNFVIQSALDVAEIMRVTSGSVMYQFIVDQIQENYAFLHSHMYGKRVLIKLNKLQGAYGF